MKVDMVKINELISATQPGKMISEIEKTRYENMIKIEKMISEKNERLSALLKKMKSEKEKEKVKSERERENEI